MKILTAFGYVGFVGLMIGSSVSSATIVVTPSNPQSSQNIHIQLVNQYFSEAGITSATIVRSGTQFTINQSVSESCFLPNAPILTSDFVVGVLPAGTYQVFAQIQNTRPCGNIVTTESATFAVVDPQAVPAAGPLSYVVMGCLLAIFGTRRLNAVKRAWPLTTRSSGP